MSKEINSPKFDFIFLDKEDKINKVIASLDDIYSQMEGKHGECSGDFPKISIYKEKLKKIDWTRLKKVDTKLIDRVSNMLDRDMARCGNFTIILLAAYSNESDLSTFTLLTVWLFNFLALGYGRKSCS